VLRDTTGRGVENQRHSCDRKHANELDLVWCAKPYYLPPHLVYTNQTMPAFLCGAEVWAWTSAADNQGAP